MLQEEQTLVVILIGASIFADLCRRMQDRRYRVFHIKSPSIQSLQRSKYLIEKRVRRICKYHEHLSYVVVAQIPGNSIFPADVQLKGHAHKTDRAPILETVQTFMDVIKSFNFQTKVKILVIPPLPRLLETVCGCAEALKYNDGLKELRDIEQYVQVQLRDVQDIYLIKTRQIFEKIFCNSKINGPLYENRDVGPKQRLRRMATKDALIKKVCYKYLLAEDLTHLTDLGGDAYTEAVYQLAVDLHNPDPNTRHSGEFFEG